MNKGTKEEFEMIEKLTRNGYGLNERLFEQILSKTWDEEYQTKLFVIAKDCFICEKILKLVKIKEQEQELQQREKKIAFYENLFFGSAGLLLLLLLFITLIV